MRHFFEAVGPEALAKHRAAMAAMDALSDQEQDYQCGLLNWPDSTDVTFTLSLDQDNVLQYCSLQ
jgi:hypothetical protein